LLVCGSRRWADIDAIFSAMDEAKPACVIHGGAPGADRIAGEWAKARGVPCEVFPADWAIGAAAGPIRNTRMLKEGRPDLVLAFALPKSRGTADLVAKARRAGVQVRVTTCTEPRP